MWLFVIYILGTINLLALSFSRDQASSAAAGKAVGDTGLSKDRCLYEHEDVLKYTGIEAR